MQDRQRGHGQVAHLGAVAAVESLGGIIADHFDAKAFTIVAGGVDAIGARSQAFQIRLGEMNRCGPECQLSSFL